MSAARAVFTETRKSIPFLCIRSFGGSDADGVKYSGQANYATAKMGIIGLTKTIAKEWGPNFGVRANTVAFGSVVCLLFFSFISPHQPPSLADNQSLSRARVSRPPKKTVQQSKSTAKRSPSESRRRSRRRRRDSPWFR